MTRYEFISVLKDKLYLLNENECRDIIEEYMAHIDMKMAEGKSEAEAIKDFGDIGDLASEILAAYHIDSTKLNDIKQQKEKSAESTKNAAGKITEKAQKIKKLIADYKRDGYSLNLAAADPEQRPQIDALSVAVCSGKEISGVLTLLSMPGELEKTDVASLLDSMRKTARFCGELMP